MPSLLSILAPEHIEEICESTEDIIVELEIGCIHSRTVYSVDDMARDAEPWNREDLESIYVGRSRPGIMDRVRISLGTDNEVAILFLYPAGEAK